MNTGDKIKKIISLLEDFPDTIFLTTRESGISRLAKEGQSALPDEVIAFFREHGEIGFESGGRIGGEVFPAGKYSTKNPIRKLAPEWSTGLVVGGEESEFIVLREDGRCIAIDAFTNFTEEFDDIFDVIISYVEPCINPMDE